jgi:hypothetical protein
MRQDPVGYRNVEIRRQTSSRKEEIMTHTNLPFTGTNIFVILNDAFRSEDCWMILKQPESTTVVRTTLWLTTSLKRNNADLTSFATKLSLILFVLCFPLFAHFCAHLYRRPFHNVLHDAASIPFTEDIVLKHISDMTCDISSGILF